MKINVMDGSATSVMDEDGLFSCAHDGAIIEPPCCIAPGESGYIECGCGGRYSLHCPDCEDKLTEHEIEEIMERR